MPYYFLVFINAVILVSAYFLGRSFLATRLEAVLSWVLPLVVLIVAFVSQAVAAFFCRNVGERTQTTLVLGFCLTLAMVGFNCGLIPGEFSWRLVFALRGPTLAAAIVLTIMEVWLIKHPREA